LNGDLAERRAFQVQAYLEASAANSGAKLARRIYRGEGDEESSRSLGDSPNDGRQRAVDVNINAGTKVTTPPPEPGYENFEITLLGGLTFGVKAVGAAYSELIAVFNIAEIPSAAGDIKETTTEMKYYFASPFGLSITSVGPKDILPMLAKEWKKLVKPTTSRILRSPPFAFKCSKRRFATDFVGYATFSFKAGPPDNYRLRPAAPSLAPAHTIPPELGTLAKVETLPPFDKLTTGSWAGMLDNTNPPEPFRTMFRKLENGT
jgi:hypothetical protein